MNNIPFKITPTAIRELHRLIMKYKILPPEGVRIAIENNNFIIGFDKPTPNDVKYEIKNITFYIDKNLLPQIEGLIINFYNGLEKQGFYFEKK